MVLLLALIENNAKFQHSVFKISWEKLYMAIVYLYMYLQNILMYGILPHFTRKTNTGKKVFGKINVK